MPHLRPLDLTIVALYLVGITLFGLRFRKKSAANNGLRSYFLADNTIPWWAIALSIVSAETSTLTIISVPGVAFTGDFSFLQIVLGYMLGRIVVALLFLPRYFRGEMLTAYQLIEQRFGSTLHKVTAGLFLLTRAAAEGVRVFAVSIVVGIAIGTRDVLSIAIISALTLLYTFEGGMAAVIWTDVVQMAIYLAGTLVAVWSLGQHVGADRSVIAGWHTIHTVASAAGKFHMFHFALNLTTTYTFWAGILGGTFLTMASHGTDQLMVQRMLAARSLRESRLALLSSGVVIFIQFTLFLLIGAGLYVFAKSLGGPFIAPASGAMSGVTTTSGSWIQGLAPDRIFPTFIVREMPLGLAGLLVAAILAAAMSNLSAALNSLSSTTVVDFYMHLRPNADSRERNLIAKSSTVLWAIVLFAIAIYSLSVGGKGHVVEIGLSIASVAYGCLLGVFLLGTLTKFATQTGATIGMVCGFALNLWLWQGTFPMHILNFTIPHIAWTWYVLIGAFVTFAIGSLFSLVFRKQSRRTAAAAASALLLLFCLSFPKGICVSAAAQKPGGPFIAPALGAMSGEPQKPDFTPVSTLINDAIAAHKLPGAIVLIGHDNKIVFEHAYGDRKLANEPGLDGKPSPAEPMTEDTLFDIASLTKVIATAPAIMKLYEQGKITSFDDPVEKYLPAFNESHDPTRSKVTLRMLLTHTSGAAPDVSLADPWGLAAPDRAEGLHRALTTPLMSTPGENFRYSDINFILLGDIIETLSGQREDDYVRDHIFLPLGMTETSYLALDKACGPHTIVGVAIVPATLPAHTRILTQCPAGEWSTSLIPRIAPTTHDNEGTAATNPDFDHLLRGTVNDPTARRMGGVAGHAGVFSTAHDLSLYAQALLDKLLHNNGPFPLKQSTLEIMTSPQQPGHTAADITHQPSDQYPSRANHRVRGFGWDIDSDFSRPRGTVFPIGSFGHTGFTGTSLWIDPASETYVILLANSIHPRGNPSISHLRGDVATAAAKALGLDKPSTNGYPEASASGLITPQKDSGLQRLGYALPDSDKTLTGIDVLEQTHFAALDHLHHIALFTNQSGLDSHGHRTIDVLTTNHQPLTTIFTPEHGLTAALDTEKIASTTDATTHLPVISLYGAHEADRRPTHAQLANLDAVVIDLQNAGVRFWTYEAATAYFLEAASLEAIDYHHDLQIILLDRPNPVGGLAVEGPVSDPDLTSYVNSAPVPVRHGLTLGEFARYYVVTQHLFTHLTVIPMQHWSRSQLFASTGLTWTPPSPNLRTPDASILYPALGLIETTNISVGRGTEHPFSFFGAPWLNAETVAAALTARRIPGVTFTATTESIADDANHYPFHGQTIPAVRLTVTDPAILDTPELGIEILAVLHKLYPRDFQLEKVQRLLCSRATLAALQRGDDPRTIESTWQPAIQAFRNAVKPFLLYH
jgi:SSS family transporter